MKALISVESTSFHSLRFSGLSSFHCVTLCLVSRLVSRAIAGVMKNPKASSIELHLAAFVIPGGVLIMS